MTRDRTWLCPAALDRPRVIDMWRRMRRPRNAGVLLTVIVALAAIPIVGALALAVAASVGIAFIVVDVAVARADRPEYAVMVELLIPIVALAILVADRGGAANPAMPLMILPVVGSAAVLPTRGAVLVLGFATVALAAATIGATPAAFADDPRLTLATLTTLVTAGLMTRQLMQSEVTQRSRAVLDPLTGLLNRASLAERFAELRAQAIRTDGRLAMVLGDLDHFKLVNDVHGHQVGDTVLQGAADEMRHSLRGFELIYRLGGEEFLVLLPGAGLDDAAKVAERMRAAVSRRPVGDVPMSASFGVSAAEGEEIELDLMLEAADRALRAAKRGGRDQVASRSARPRELRAHEPVPHSIGQQLALAHDQPG